MSPAMQLAFDEAVKWSVPTAGAAAAAWAGIRWRVLRNWCRKRKANGAALEAMVDSWPSVVGQIAESSAQAGRNTEQFAALHRRHDQLDKDLGDLLAINHGQFELSPQPSFVCDSDGCNTLVNSAYARMLHCGRDDLMGYGYKRFIPPYELHSYVPRFEAAAFEHREFESELLMHCADGAPLRVRVRVVPHPRYPGPATHWIGTVTLLEGQC